MTIDEIITLLDNLQGQFDQLRDAVYELQACNPPYDEARRLTAEWALKGFPEINMVDIPLSTIQPSEVAGFMKPLTNRRKPVVEANVEAWLRYNNHQGKSDVVPHVPGCRCYDCYAALVERQREIRRTK